MLRHACRGFAALLLLAISVAGAPNPYGVSGADWTSNGTMAKLGMPADCLGYIWDSLRPTNLPNMVRPCKYWLAVGGQHQAWGYHEDTDTIDNPTFFASWLTANPGKVWIIGNEQNGGGQDGLSPQQYARMFKTYHDFITARDPSAKLAVGALAADTELSSVADNTNWWNQALQAYKDANAGQAMPIDIWNCHGYTRVGRMNADRVSNDFFTPYRQLVDTIDGGRYAGAELWCTEFGVSTWSAQCSNQHLGQFAAQLCPRLERSGISRFFWFIGPWDNWSGGLFQDTCLLGPTGSRTALGDVYQQLAQTYAAHGLNPIPPPPPARSAPPWFFSDAFDSAPSGDWDVQAGDWSTLDGEYRQLRTVGAFSGVSSRLNYDYHDVYFRADLRILSAPDNLNWAGITLRGGGMWDDADPIGYLVLLRQNGALALYIAADNYKPVEIPGVVADTSVFHTLRVRIAGYRITVDVDDRIGIIDYTDALHRRTSGDVGLITGQVQAAFDNVTVGQLFRADFDQDGDVDQEGFGRLQACYSGEARDQPDSSCLPAKFDGDNDVDASDFIRFQACFTGPGILADPQCGE